MHRLTLNPPPHVWRDIIFVYLAIFRPWLLRQVAR